MAEGGGLAGEVTHGKIGKVPVWAAGVGFSVLFILFMMYRNKKAAGKAVSSGGVIPPSPDLGTGTDQGAANVGLPGGPLGDWLAANPTNPAFPVGHVPQGLPSPVTNAQWARGVTDGLLSKGSDPTIVTNALAKFLSGSPLSAAEQAVINIAQQMFGAPPEGIIAQTPIGGGTLTGLRETGAGKDWVSASWDPYPGAISYRWTQRSPYGAGSVEVLGTSYKNSGLAAPGTDHQITVQPRTMSGLLGGQTITIRTTGIYGGGLITPTVPGQVYTGSPIDIGPPQ